MEIYSLSQQEKFIEAQKKVKNIKGFFVHATVFVFVNILIIAASGFADVQSLFTISPYITALYWGIGLGAHGMSVFGQDFIFGKNWEEKEIQNILNR